MASMHAPALGTDWECGLTADPPSLRGCDVTGGRPRSNDNSGSAGEHSAGSLTPKILWHQRLSFVALDIHSKSLP